MNHPLRLILLLVIGIGIIGTVETAFNPGNSFAAPFRPTAILTLTVVSKGEEAIKDSKTVAASEELRIVSDAVSEMMITSDLSSITPVAVPTNDMSAFPSQLYSLYPGYIKNQSTEFLYTVNAQGNVSLSSPGSATDPFLDTLLGNLNQLTAQ
jgi:hypothetical protein